MKMKKVKIFTLLFALTLIMSATASARVTQQMPNQTLRPNQEEEVSADMCSTADAQSVVIAWASEDTGELHLSIAVREYNKGDCVEFKLVNADIETDGTWADHDFDFPSDLNPSLGEDYHQEFFRNETVKHVFVQLPDEDVTLTAICGVPGHRAAGMETTIKVGAGSGDESSSSDTGSSPGFGLIAAFTAFAMLASVPVIRRKLR
jgi:hypothetical protein